MNVERLTEETREAFLQFSKNHRQHVDDSHLYPDDLNNFVVNEENPTYLVRDEAGEILAAASIMTGGYYQKSNSGRFRIFYSESKLKAHYQALWESLKPNVTSLTKTFVFVPLTDQETGEALREVGFTIERYSFILVKKIGDKPELHLPEELELRSLKRGEGQIWCDIRNPSFATLKGSEKGQEPVEVEQSFDREDYLEGGKLVLYLDGKAVAVVACSKDELDEIPTVDIGPLAVHPDYQGKGFGRLMLRAAEQFAYDKGYTQVVLSVNGENERAKRLYEQEGFQQIEGVACYTYLFGE
ncbi:GNAT family N-acetyltransferase [Paenisporosarcina cavernae]|nr:GNAT family N-acetyltransferase [Paenisporosarcina cavernae]